MLLKGNQLQSEEHPVEWALSSRPAAAAHLQMLSSLLRLLLLQSLIPLCSPPPLSHANCLLH